MTLPWRAVGSDRGTPPVDPAALPKFRRLRPLKRWRYVGVYGPDLQFCVGLARIAGAAQSFWAVHHRPTGFFREHAVMRASVDLSDGTVSFPGCSLTVRPAGDPVEVVSDHGGNPIWTLKTPVRVTGHLTLDGLDAEIDSAGLQDDSAGHHARVTQWRWSAGCGVSPSGEQVTWNLVDGVHDSAESSERTVWVDGVARETPPVEFAGDLSWVGAGADRLSFAKEAERARHDRLVVINSRYRQPFGTFAGTVPGGVDVAEGYGVMEEHDVRW